MPVDPQEWLKTQPKPKVDPQQWLLQQQSAEKAPDVVAAPESMPWSDVPKQAVTNLPKSLGNVISGIGQTLAHPLDTTKGLLDIAAGGLQNALPESVNNAIASIDPGAENAKAAREKADAVGNFYKERYGSEEGVKHALANDPAGVAMDASMLLSGGGALAAKVPGLSKVGGIAQKAGATIDPVMATAKLAKSGINAAGNTAANLVGGIGTHTGGESIKAAFRSGVNGGQKAADFADNMRGKVTADEILPELQSSLAKMRESRSAAYKQGMADVGKDVTVIPMQNIDNAINSALSIKRFKGESLSPTTEGVQGEILAQFERWKNLDPAQYHTAEGLDAFKQVIGDIRQNTAPGTPQRAVADKVYKSVRQEIIKQAPEYAQVMKDYEEASKLTNEIERALSLGEKASADTAIRKLQSLTRNNVSTNYGNRIKLAKELENSGGADFMNKLQGQALSSWQPRGLGGIVSGGAGAYGLYAHDPAMLPILAIQSPRLMGETALAAGKVAGAGGKTADQLTSAISSAGIDPQTFANWLYQAQQPKGQ